LVFEGDLTIVDDPGEDIVVRLLMPVGEVILGVCHSVLAHVAGHQQMVLRSSLGYFVLHKVVLIFTQRGLYLEWLRINWRLFFHHCIQYLGQNEIIWLLIGERDPTLSVHLLIPVVEVILGVRHSRSQEQPWILCTAQRSVNIHAKRVIFMLVEDKTRKHFSIIMFSIFVGMRSFGY
jgi:hypothetical protein